jgi:thiamine biosynthesis protein ThiS
MRVRVNGTERQVPPDLTLAHLLSELGLPSARVAVERNREIVRRDAYDSTRLADGDILEIVQLVGGG